MQANAELELRVAERTAALAGSEARLDLASRAAGMGVCDLDVGTGTVVVSEQYRRVFGLPSGDASLTFEESLARVLAEDHARVLRTVRAAIDVGGDYRDEYRIRRADTDETRWVAARGHIVKAGQSSPRLLGVCYDVTEGRAQQERQTLLAREVDHRAKNVLAVVSSIVTLTSAEDPQQFAEAVGGRVAALARAHTLLAGDRWTGAGLEAVVHEELGAYEGGGRVMVQGPPVRLQPEAVQPLSMVLHELVTNAAKYGALSRPGGRVEVSWQLDPNGNERVDAMLRVTWIERGGPALPGPPGQQGFGSTVIQATVEGQLGGMAEMHWEMEGLRCEIAMAAEFVLVATTLADAEDMQPPPAFKTAAEPASVPLRGRRVLIVVDEQLVALGLAATLRELGCEVVGPAGTLEAALELAGGQAEQLDAAVLDLNLRGRGSSPVSDALSVFGVPIVYVTGYASMPYGRAADAGPLLGKPLRPGQLAAALRQVLASREGAAGPAAGRGVAGGRPHLA